MSINVVFIKSLRVVAFTQNIVHGVVLYDYWSSYLACYNTTCFGVVHVYNCDMYLQVVHFR